MLPIEMLFELTGLETRATALARSNCTFVAIYRMGKLMGTDVFEGKEPPMLVVKAMVILAVERAMTEVVDVVL